MANFYGSYIGYGSGGGGPSFHGAASSLGFAASGTQAGPTWPNVAYIDKYSLVSATPGATVGNITVSRRNIAGAFWSDYGYGAGGDASPGTIDKWSHSSDGDAVGVGDLVAGPTNTNVGCSSTDYGYASGGNPPTNMIQRWSFASGTQNASDVGNLTASGRTDYAGSNHSSDYGYCVGGGQSGDYVTIDKWSFDSGSEDAEDVGDLTIGTWSCGSNSSVDHGYTMGGGLHSAGRCERIDRFSFATGTQNADDVGDLLRNTQGSFGASTSSHGYSAGGTDPTPGLPSYHPVWTDISKYAFAASADAVDTTADLTQARTNGASSQV